MGKAYHSLYATLTGSNLENNGTINNSAGGTWKEQAIPFKVGAKRTWKGIGILCIKDVRAKILPGFTKDDDSSETSRAIQKKARDGINLCGSHSTQGQKTICNLGHLPWKSCWADLGLINHVKLSTIKAPITIYHILANFWILKWINSESICNS